MAPTRFPPSILPSRSRLRRSGFFVPPLPRARRRQCPRLRHSPHPHRLPVGSALPDRFSTLKPAADPARAASRNCSRNCTTFFSAAARAFCSARRSSSRRELAARARSACSTAVFRLLLNSAFSCRTRSTSEKISPISCLNAAYDFSPTESFSSAGSTGNAAETALAGCARSARSFAFAARRVANSFAVSPSCCANFAASLELASRLSPGPLVALPELPALAARASRSARHVLRGTSADGVATAAISLTRPVLAASVAARGAGAASGAATAVTAVELDDEASASLLSVGAVAQPANASTKLTDNTGGSARRVMSGPNETPGALANFTFTRPSPRPRPPFKSFPFVISQCFLLPL